MRKPVLDHTTGKIRKGRTPCKRIVISLPLPLLQRLDLLAEGNRAALVRKLLLEALRVPEPHAIGLAESQDFSDEKEARRQAASAERLRKWNRDKLDNLKIVGWDDE